jgi:uncharacterized membrane protein required for colicin V production
MTLDILIVLCIVAGVGFGFWKGLFNQGLIIVGVYLGALVGRFVYEPIAQPLTDIIHLDLHFAQLLIFLLIVILVPVGLFLAAHALWGSLRLPYAWGQLDLLGGAVLGAVVGLLAAMLLILSAGFLFINSHVSTASANDPLFVSIQSAWSTSRLRDPVVQVGQFVYYSLLPNVGATVPNILQVFAPR